jgi:SAM-dependent MidA family methyltransferase
MKDILRVAAKFSDFRAALKVHMVELSGPLRAAQMKAIGCQITDRSAVLKEKVKKPQKTVDDVLSGRTLKDGNAKDTVESIVNDIIDDAPLSGKTADGVPVTWYSMLGQIPSSSGPSLIIAQEFLDAFPVHQFVYTNKGWREKLVDVDKNPQNELHFRPVLAPSRTPAVAALLSQKATSGFKEVKTFASRSAAQTQIKSGTFSDSSGNSSNISGSQSQTSAEPLAQEGDEVEISPLALATCEDIATRVLAHSGAALIIDYGENFTQGDSLRGFKKHNLVNIFSEPGLVDITADVDFAMCAKSAVKKGAKVYGATTQGEFLMRMGIVERLEKLIEQPETTDDQATQMVKAFRVLVGGDNVVSDDSDSSSDSNGRGNMKTGLGKRFKVLSIAHPDAKVEGFGP